MTAAAVQPPHRTQADRREETQRKLLDAAIEILRHKGYAGLRTVEVAQLAQVSRGALTHHYPSKELLVAAAMEDVFSEARKRGVARAARAGADIPSTLGRLLEDCEEFYFGGFFRIAIELATVSGPDSEIAHQSREISAATRTPVEVAWRAALERAGLNPDLSEDIVHMASGMVRGLAVRKFLKDEPARFRRLLAIWQQSILQYLEAAASTQRATAPLASVRQKIKQ